MPIRKARTSDVKSIQKLINAYAKKHKLIPRSLNDLYEKIRDLTVYDNAKGTVQGVCALHVAWEDLAEIRSLAVSSRSKGKGIGKALVRHALKEATHLGVKKVFVLTYYPEYFQQLGFEEVDKAKLPHKIWADCLNCHKFPECDETAVQLKLKAK
ncbi:MAG TPA: N-acetyltransferase [Nitrospirae bacterium]|nr:N-acetyltransferase [Nitrospirota bacterium]